MANIAIVNSSNGRDKDALDKLKNLEEMLKSEGHELTRSEAIFYSPSQDKRHERARALNAYFQDPELEAICDISGGDQANELLDLLDYPAIQESQAHFYGYSDLTTIINAIFSQTGKASCLYQVMNRLEYEYAEDFSYEFFQGKEMEGTVIGGNIRCFLKLAGTKYWPNPDQKILFLEARSGQLPQMKTYLSQLKQLGVFERVSGILLGSFTEMEASGAEPAMVDLVKAYLPKALALAKTDEIGHQTDSKAIWIGRQLKLGGE